MKPLERPVERVLWASRLLVLIAVVASLVVAVSLFIVISLDVLELLGRVIHYAGIGLDAAERSGLRSDLIAQVIDIVDGYLLAAVMLIFALGLYELFVSRIDEVENSEFANRLLAIRSLDDLKDRLAKVVLLMLVVKFFQYALKFKYNSPLELLYLAIGILLIGGALYLSGHHAPAGH
jgi:uncharacterized membrane protein YqhA